MRTDFYDRLSSIKIESPPLRKRKTDIKELTDYYINYYNKEMNKNIKGVAPEVFKLFNSYDWPGNIREFKNIMESAFNFAGSAVITKEDIPKIVGKKVANESTGNGESGLYSGNSLNDALENFERSFIVNKAKDASSLSNLADLMQISRQTLNYKIKKYNIKFNEINS